MILAGEEVEIESRVTKAGKTLGFADSFIRKIASNNQDNKEEEEGELVAFGRHCKYLKMGGLWEWIMSPLLFPLTFFLAKHFIHSYHAKKFKDWTMTEKEQEDVQVYIS